MVCGAVVAHVPSKHVCLCSDKCAFVVCYADGVYKIMLVVTCGDRHAVWANLHKWVCCPTPSPPPPWYTQHIINSGVLMGTLIDRTKETSIVSSHYESVRSYSYKLEYMYTILCVCSVYMCVCMHMYICVYVHINKK